MVVKRSTWMAVPGLAIWAQLFLGAALAEWQYADMRLLYLGAYFLPLLVMTIGYWVDGVGVLQIGFLASLLPAFLILPAEDQLTLSHPVGVLWLCGLVAVYLLMGTDWFVLGVAQSGEESEGGEQVDVQAGVLQNGGSAGVLEETQRERQDYVASLHANYRHHFVTRFAVVLWLFGLTTYAVFFDAGIQGSISAYFAGSEQVAVSFIAVSMFFAWCMVVYMMIVVPAMNLEYDQRRLQLSVAALAQTKLRRVAGFRIFGWVLLSVAAGWLAVYLQ